MNKRIGLILAIICVPHVGAQSAGADPKDIASGKWHGPGYVSLKSGKKIFVQCVVEYKKKTPTILGFEAVCATNAVRISQSGKLVRSKPAVYFGYVYNAEYDVRGLVSVEDKGARQIVNIKAKHGAGRIVLTRRQ